MKRLQEKIYKKIIKDGNFDKVAKEDAGLTKDDTDLGWNTRNELPEEIIDSVFKLSKDKISEPIKSSFGWRGFSKRY